jgi:hypothetical protein
MQKILSYSLFLGLLGWLAVGAGCQDAETTSGPAIADTTATTPNVGGSQFSLNEVKTQLKGWVDDVPVELAFELSGSDVKGEVSYPKTGKKSKLSGTIDFMGRFNFQIAGENGNNLASGVFLDNSSLRGFWDHAYGAEPFEFIASAGNSQPETKAPADLHTHTIYCREGLCHIQIQTPTLPLARQTILTLLPLVVCNETEPCPAPEWKSEIGHADETILSGWTGAYRNGKIVSPQYWTFLQKPKPQIVLLSDFITQPGEFMKRLQVKNKNAPVNLLNEFDFTVDPNRLLVSTLAGPEVRLWIEFSPGELSGLLNPDHPVGALLLNNKSN